MLFDHEFFEDLLKCFGIALIVIILFGPLRLQIACVVPFPS
jgi:hypothetical protein